jgi:hypothetical protein
MCEEVVEDVLLSLLREGEGGENVRGDERR